MKRAVSVGVAVVAAAGLVALLTPRDASVSDAAAPVERLLAEGRIADARREIASSRGRVPASVTDYAEGLVLLAEGRDADAAVPLARAHQAEPGEWRIVSSLAAALANAGRGPEALALLDGYTRLRPGDERGLAALAQHALRGAGAQPDASRALEALERIRALPVRVAKEGDPTRVPDATLARLRVRALLLLTRRADALVEARELVRTDAASAESWYLLGEAARTASPPLADESLAAYRRAAALAPDDRRVGEQFALALLKFDVETAEVLGVAERLLSRAPNDPALQILYARALVRAQRIDDAHAVYAALLAQGGALPREHRIAVLRNLAVLFVDWGAAGRPGPYLEDARNLLQEYLRLGGTVDEDLDSTLRQLRMR